MRWNANIFPRIFDITVEDMNNNMHSCVGFGNSSLKPINTTLMHVFEADTE